MIEWRPKPPKWQQVMEALRARIEDGTYPAESTIPSLDRIQQEFEVGENTAKHAVRSLAEQGFVVPVRSRGTFVVPPEERRG